jgi:tetratricopeptide (TPR) repeat protein
MGCTVLLVFSSLLAGPAHEGMDLQIARATKEIEAQPARADLYLARAELHRVHEDWAAAKADYDRALALDSNLSRVELGRGRMWLAIGDAREAQRCLDRFLTREPNHGEGMIERGRALVRLGKRAEGAAEYDRALARLAQPVPEFYLERADALRTEKPPRLDEAVKGLDEGIRKLGPVVTLRLAAIDLELELKRYDSALARVEEIARQSERKDPWLVRRGEILRQAGRVSEAREAFVSALRCIEALPASRRAAPFTRDLEQRVRTALEVIDVQR